MTCTDKIYLLNIDENDIFEEEERDDAEDDDMEKVNCGMYFVDNLKKRQTWWEVSCLIALDV